jgi:hypothetical protein
MCGLQAGSGAIQKQGKLYVEINSDFLPGACANAIEITQVSWQVNVLESRLVQISFHLRLHHGNTPTVVVNNRRGRWNRVLGKL